MCGCERVVNVWYRVFSSLFASFSSVILCLFISLLVLPIGLPSSSRQRRCSSACVLCVVWVVRVLLSGFSCACFGRLCRHTRSCEVWVDGVIIPFRMCRGWLMSGVLEYAVGGWCVFAVGNVSMRALRAVGC